MDEFTRLPGYEPSEMCFAKAGLSQRDAAGLLGNCMSGNVLRLILPAVLYSGGSLMLWSASNWTR